MEKRDYAVVLLLLERDGREELLLEVRSKQLRRQPGEVCLPGGGIGEKEDGAKESPEEAALRECEEELLVEKSGIRIERALPLRLAPDGGTVYPFLGRLLRYDGTFRREEVSEILRIPVSFFLETEPERYQADLVTVPREGFPYERIPGEREYPFQKKETEVLFYDYHGITIWGLTAAVIESYVSERKKERPERTIREKYDLFVRGLIEKNRTITTMESCTSGQIASLITDTEGASAIFPGAFVTYSNEAKARCGVPEPLMERYGVYSLETAEAMARAALVAYKANIGIGITGSFSNPDPRNGDSVPGEVYLAFIIDGEVRREKLLVPPLPSRQMYKLYVAEHVIDRLLSFTE